jgi:hypothetical protein
VIGCFVDIDGIVDHHCLDVIFYFVDIGWIHQYQQNKQSALNSDGQQFNKYQQSKQSPLNVMVNNSINIKKTNNQI